MFSNDISALALMSTQKSPAVKTKIKKEGSKKTKYYVIGSVILLLILFRTFVGPMLNKGNESEPAVYVEETAEDNTSEGSKISDDDLKAKIRQELGRVDQKREALAASEAASAKPSEGQNAVVAPSSSATPAAVVQESGAEYITNRKKILLGVFVDSETAVSILGDAPQLLIKGTPYTRGETITGGFEVGSINFEKGKTETFSDIKMKATIVDSKSKDVLREVTLTLGDFYTINFYEGAIEINEKGSSRGTGVVLPNERLTSAFHLEAVVDGEESSIYTLNLGDGNFVKEVVPVARIK